MGIVFDKNSMTFTLNTKNTTYQMRVDKFGFVLHQYYGKKVEGCMDYLITYIDRSFSGNPYEAGTDRTYSMDVLPQELPSFGNGDYRSPACIIKNFDGSYACDFRYRNHKIRDGKYALKGLPAVYADDTEAETLELYLMDPVSRVKLVLYYGVLPELDIITRSVKLINDGDGRISVEKLMPACLDMLTGDFDIISFNGRHAMERGYCRSEINPGIYKVESLRGTSSHQHNPCVIMAEKNATEDAGQCFGLAFVYSGGFQCEVEKSQFNQVRLLMGLEEEMFSYELKSGEEFVSPEVIMSYSSDGLTQLSQNFHLCMRNHLCRGKYRDIRRPILINSWEAAYFDFTGEKLLSLASSAAELGVEMLVLDDGWFGNRNSDSEALGDWQVNERKLGCSLGDFIQKVNDIGLKFGIWFEPEMVSEKSRLYREHPDWVLRIPGRWSIRSRYQLVLDFSRKTVVDYIYEQVCAVLDQGNVEYIKWDMNRSLADIYSIKTDCQGKVMYDYVLGLYDFLERLVNRYPNILIEGCSGGGGRFDAGMLYYTPQIWCSDNTDAVDRVHIQYGTSFFYPVSAVGSHVSAERNHQTGRITSLHTRGVVAMAGTFGYELNLEELNDEEKDEIRTQIRKYRYYADLIRTGLYYRLSNPETDPVGAWMIVKEDGSEALVSAVLLELHANMPVNYVRLKGLKENTFYRDTFTDQVYNSTALMEVGVPLKVPEGEYQAYEMHLLEEG